MNLFRHGPWVRGGIVLLALFCCLPAAATDPPDSAINPRSGLVETVDAVRLPDGMFSVRHVIDPGNGVSRITNFLCYPNETVDPQPRVSMNPDGDTWVAWHMTGHAVMIKAVKYSYATQTWGEELSLYNWFYSSYNLEMVHDGLDLWIVAEVYDVSNQRTEITVYSIHDGPDPIPTAARKLGITDHTGDIDVLIHYESGHLWVTWIDSETEIGWSEYDYESGTWTPAEYEDYESDDPDAARERIADFILSASGAESESGSDPGSTNSRNR